MKKQQARNLYFQTELTQTRIAELLDVDRKTIYLWIKEGRWAEIKRSAQHAPSILAEQYYSQLLAINEMIAEREEQPYPTSQEAEIIRKLTLTIKHIKDGQTRGETIEVLMNFIHQITKTDLPLAKQILPHADQYIKDYNNNPIIKPKESNHKEIEEENQPDPTPQPETQPQIPVTSNQPPHEGSLRETKQSFATRSEKHDHITQSQPLIKSENPQPQQTPDLQNMEPPAIAESANYRIAELSKTGYKWATNEQPIFTMREALIHYRHGDWSDNTWLQFLKWHSRQNGENSTSK
ncbi:MAG TPA: hypothetical protein VN721_05115 [Flavipsychrobacter sp.]|nr:hypothetical protein [Flavipsychrobacter sp.]